MKIAVSSMGSTPESQLDQRFGRAGYFIITDTDKAGYEVIDNSAAASAGGAGITSAQTVVDKGVEAVITGNVGPNAMSVLKAAQIDIFKGSKASVKENAEMLKKGLLQKIDSAVPQHFGLSSQGG